MVKLDPTSNPTEYNRVADEIRKTASINITKIERVQNPGLYRAYMVKKDQMEQKNGANEKFLFHGTAQGSCSSINKFGFNRSYCGKNGKRRRLTISIIIIIGVITIIVFIFIVMVIIFVIIYFMGDLDKRENTFKDRVFEKDAGMIKVVARICNYEGWCFDEPTAFL